MAGPRAINIQLLRDSTRQGQAAHLGDVLASRPADVCAITSELIEHVSTDYLPSVVLSSWLCVCKDPRAIIAVLRQPHSAVAQQAAIHRLYRQLRKEKTFSKAWEAGGAATGFAEITASLSVRNVRLLCTRLGHTAFAPSAREERQRGLSELLRLLWANLDSDPTRVKSIRADPRPLKDAYCRIIPACGGKVMVEWEKKGSFPYSWNDMVAADTEFFEQHIMEELALENITATTFVSRAASLIRIRPAFGLQVLAKFAESETLLDVPPSKLLDVVVPLVERFSSKRRMSSDSHSRLWHLIIQCLQRHQALRQHINDTWYIGTRLISHCAHGWGHSRGQQHYTDIFSTLISFFSEYAIQNYGLSRLVRNVGPRLRYQLLRLFLQHAPGYGFDIGTANSTDDIVPGSRDLKWPVELFFLLPAHESLTFFERIQVAFPNSVVPGNASSSSIYSEFEPESSVSDCQIIRALLIRQTKNNDVTLPTDLNDVLNELRLNELPRRLKKATQARDQPVRCAWAVSALSLCVAIGDLSLYAETLTWARRFNKDPLTVKGLYGYLVRHETVNLLVALPSTSQEPISNTTESDIQAANNILFLLFETATMAVKEPSFHYTDWQSVFSLIADVVVKRLALANAFQDRCKVSNSQLFEIVWKPTLDMLVDMERALLRPVNKPLSNFWDRTTLTGLLPDFYNGELRDLREPAMKFFDSLAEARDSLWVKHRTSENASVFTLGKPWPRGLPIQHLFHCRDDIRVRLPYIQSRAEAVVFSPVAEVLKPLPEPHVQKSLGRFVDRWPEALRIYLLQPDEEENRRTDRISKAWKHATINLSRDRMSTEEAERFWMPIFKHAGVKDDELGFHASVQERTAPVLPVVDDPMQPTEWNPDPGSDSIEEPCESRRLSPTCLDVMLKSGGYHHSETHPFSDLDPTVPENSSRPEFWEIYHRVQGEVTGKAANAYFAAGILTLNSRIGSNTSLLMQPFPKDGYAILPALYLDQDFLERQSNSGSMDILQMIEYIKIFISPRLLAQLASSVLERILNNNNKEEPEPYREFVELINLLSQGDCPSLANPLIQRFVLELPGASSWHRMLLHQGHLCNLSPYEVKDFLDTFSNNMFEKLESQAARDATTTQPLVKITTIKMFAQLLQGAPFISPALTCDFHTGLLTKTRHIDIRRASLQGLVELTTYATTSTLRLTVLDELRKHAAPMAASLDEFSPPTNWEEAESSATMPFVTDSNLGIPSVLSFLLRIGIGENRWPPEEERALIDFKYSVLQASAENNQRWIALFLKKHGFSIPDGNQLPAVPVYPRAVIDVFSRHAPRVPRQYFELMKDYVRFNLDPPPWLSSIAKAIKEDQKLLFSGTVTHWLTLWDKRAEDALPFGVAWAAEHLNFEMTPLDHPYPDNVTNDMLEQFVFEVVDISLRKADLKCFDRLVGVISGERIPNVSSDKIGDRRPYLRRIINRIDSLRTPEWQSNPQRDPAFLPDTFPLKLQILIPRGATTPEEGIAELTDGIVKLMEELVASGTPYNSGFELIKSRLGNLKPIPEIAIAVGSLPEKVDSAGTTTLVDHLRVELAAYLLAQCQILQNGHSSYDKDLVRQASEMVEQWGRSSVEYVRNKANESRWKEKTGFGLFD